MQSENRLLFYTIAGVALAHFVVLASSLVFEGNRDTIKRPQKLMIKTLALKPVQESSSKPLVSPQKSSPPPPKKQETKVPPKTPVVASKKQNSASSQKAELLKKTKDNLAKMNKKETRDAELADVREITPQELSAFETGNFEKTGYRDILIMQLRQQLRLPETGGVKMQLTLDRQGKVLAVKIVSSQSNYNRKFVENALKNAQFAAFGECFKGEDKHTFSILLENEPL